MSYYKEQAYRSDQCKRPTGEPNKPCKDALWRPLDYEVKNTLPYSLFTRLPPKMMRKAEQKPFIPKWLRKTERYGALNERCIRPVSLSKLGAILENTQYIGRIFTYIMFPVGIFSIVIMMIAIEPKIILELGLFILIFMGGPFFTWMLGKLCYDFLPLTHGIGSPWELNRQTGLISQFTYDKTNPKAEPEVISVPFFEMDAFVYVMVDRFGHRFLLTLIHRHSDFEIKVGELLGGAGSMLNECDYQWYFIQNYMDVSKPLPDITLFEEFRSKDPTTAQYDQKIGRNPRHWIDMSNEEWAKQKRLFLEAQTEIDKANT